MPSLTLYGPVNYITVVLLAIRQIKDPLFSVNFTFFSTNPYVRVMDYDSPCIHPGYYAAAQEQGNTSPIDRLEITTQTFRH